MTEFTQEQLELTKACHSVFDAAGKVVQDPDELKALVDNLQERKPAEMNKDGDLDIYVTGIIGGGYFVDPSRAYTSRNLRDDLAVNEDANVNLYINSPGGSLYDGITAYSMLLRRKENTKITAYVDGAMASAATLYGIASDEVIGSNEAVGVLVHRAWGMRIGNALQLEKSVKQMKATDEQLAELYAKFTGDTAKNMLDLMSEDRLLTAKEARGYKLLTSVKGMKDDTKNIAELSAGEMAWLQFKSLTAA